MTVTKFTRDLARAIGKAVSKALNDNETLQEIRADVQWLRDSSAYTREVTDLRRQLRQRMDIIAELRVEIAELKQALEVAP